MNRPTRILPHAALMCLMALAASCLAGCALGIAGARVQLATPFSKPNTSYDSVGVAQKNDRAAGATFTAPGGTAAQADPDTMAGQADQIVQVGGDASNARSTDTGLAKDQSVVAGRETGEVDASGTRERSPGIAIPVAAGATPTATATATPGGGLTATDMDAISTAAAAKVIEALKAAGTIPTP